MNLSGIYTITNIVNNKIYVGCTTSFSKRWRDHKNLFKKCTHPNRYLSAAVKKYGFENFKFEILEECAPEYVVFLEQYWINLLDSTNKKFGYNIRNKSDSNLGFKHSEETKRKIGNANKGKQSLLGKTLTVKHKQNISNAKLNHIVSNETKEKIRKAHLGLKHTEEQKKKISLKLLNNKNNSEFKHSQEFKEALSKRMLNNKFNFGKKHSEKTKEKIRLKLLGNKNGSKINE